MAANNLTLNTGGTLDLNGGTQYVNTFSSQGAALGAAVTGGNVLSSSGTATLVMNTGTASFGGTIGGTNPVNLVRSGTGNLNLLGSVNLNGGSLLITGGTTPTLNSQSFGTVLADNGVLTNVSSITLNYGALSIDNARLSGNTDRVPNGTPITINGGALDFYGRTETLSTETVGVVTVNQGTAIISSAEHTNGASGTLVSADLTLSGLNRTPGSGATVDFSINYNSNSNTIALGLIGNAPEDPDQRRVEHEQHHRRLGDRDECFHQHPGGICEL